MKTLSILLLFSSCNTYQYKDYLDSKKPPVVKNANYCVPLKVKNTSVTLAKDESVLKSCEFIKKIETDVCHDHQGENIEIETLKIETQNLGGNILVIEETENKYQRVVGLAYKCQQ